MFKAMQNLCALIASALYLESSQAALFNHELRSVKVTPVFACFCSLSNNVFVINVLIVFLANLSLQKKEREIPCLHEMLEFVRFFVQRAKKSFDFQKVFTRSGLGTFLLFFSLSFLRRKNVEGMHKHTCTGQAHTGSPRNDCYNWMCRWVQHRLLFLKWKANYCSYFDERNLIDGVWDLLAKYVYVYFVYHF